MVNSLIYQIPQSIEFDRKYINSLIVFNKTKQGILTYPQRIGRKSQIGAYFITNNISKEMTVEKFNALMAKAIQNYGYELKDGGHLGWNAFESAYDVGNVTLMKYIAEIGGKMITNLHGVMKAPLFYVETVDMAKHLLSNGAQINGAYKKLKFHQEKNQKYYRKIYVTAFSTHLQQNNLLIAEFLYRRGAVLNPNCIHANQFKLNVIKKRNDTMLKIWLKIFEGINANPENKDIPFVPNEIIAMIAEYTYI